MTVKTNRDKTLLTETIIVTIYVKFWVYIKLAQASIDNVIAFLEQHSTSIDSLEQAWDLRKGLQSMSHVKQTNKPNRFFSFNTR